MFAFIKGGLLLHITARFATQSGAIWSIFFAANRLKHAKLRYGPLVVFAEKHLHVFQHARGSR